MPIFIYLHMVYIYLHTIYIQFTYNLHTTQYNLHSIYIQFTYNFILIFQKFKNKLKLFKDYVAAHIFLANNPNYQQ